MTKFQIANQNPAYPDFETGKDDKPIAYVLVGLPGSGKSSWAEGHPDKLPIASTDAFIEKFAKKKKISYAEAFETEYQKAVEDIKKQVAKFTKKPVPFIWDQINLKREERKAIHKRLEDTHRVVYVCFMIPLSECLRRHETRARDGGNIVDAARIKKLASITVFPEPGEEPFYKLITLKHPDWGRIP